MFNYLVNMILDVAFGPVARRNPMLTTDELDDVIRSTFDLDGNAGNVLAWMGEAYPLADHGTTVSPVTLYN